MAKMRPSNAADYAEIVIERKRQPALQGEMWVVDGLLTVTSSDGRRKTTQVGNARRLDWRGSCSWNWRTNARAIHMRAEGGPQSWLTCVGSRIESSARSYRASTAKDPCLKQQAEHFNHAP